MANVKSDIFANIYPSTGQPTLNQASNVRAAVFFTRATNLVAIADVAGTIYPVMRMPSHARILGLVVGTTTLAGATECNLGLYPETDWTDPALANPTPLGVAGAAVGVYCDGVDLSAARNILADTAAAAAVTSTGNLLGQIVGAAQVITGIQWGRRLWEDAGQAAPGPRPGTQFDLCWTIVSEPTGAGTIVTGVYYTFGA